MPFRRIEATAVADAIIWAEVLKISCAFSAACLKLLLIGILKIEIISVAFGTQRMVPLEMQTVTVMEKAVIRRDRFVPCTITAFPSAVLILVVMEAYSRFEIVKRKAS